MLGERFAIEVIIFWC